MDPISLLLILISVEVGDFYGVPPSIMMGLAWAETRYNLLALGDKDPTGVPHSFGAWQVNDRGAGAGYSQDYILEPWNNGHLAGAYMRFLLKRFDNDMTKAISAYNQGPGGVEKRGVEINRSYIDKVLAEAEKWKPLDNVKSVSFGGDR